MRTKHPLRLFWLLGLFALLFQGPAWALGTQPFIKDTFLNLQEDLADAAKAGRILMVLYEQEGCPYCAKLHQQNFKDDEIVKRITKGFDVIQLDIWGGREVTTFTGETMTEKELARKVKVQFSPTIVFYDAKGKEIHRMAGLHHPARFKTELDYLTSRAYEKMGFKDYGANQSSKIGAKGLIGEPYFIKTDDLRALAEKTWAADKVLALLFEQAGCADCQRMHDRNFKDGDTVKLLTEHFAVVQIDLVGTKKLRNLAGRQTSEAEIARALGIQQVPTMLFFDKSGKEILRYVDHLTPEHFSGAMLTFLANHEYRNHASLQDWLRARAAARDARQAQ